MKTLAAALLLGLVGASVEAASLTALERERLAAHLEMTGSWLADEVSGLSAAQFQFRPAPGVWSILEVVDHLTVTDPIYWRQFQEAMKAPPSGKNLSDKDADVLWYGIDRTRRTAALATETTTGQLRDPKAGLDALRKLHSEMLKYVKTTQEDLRAHFVPREGSDAYQWLLLISTHEQRHILQIREIKADPKFPKK